MASFVNHRQWSSDMAMFLLLVVVVFVVVMVVVGLRGGTNPCWRSH